jgi:hypothetical protein
MITPDRANHRMSRSIGSLLHGAMHDKISAQPPDVARKRQRAISKRTEKGQ